MVLMEVLQTYIQIFIAMRMSLSMWLLTVTWMRYLVTGLSIIRLKAGINFMMLLVLTADVWMYIIHQHKQGNLRSMEWYQIAGTVFTMEWTPGDEWRLFQTEQTERFDFGVCFEGSENSACGVRKTDLGQMEYMLVNGTEILLVDGGWSRGRLVFQEDTVKAEYLVMQMYYANAVQRGFILFHSSLISVSGCGLMFIGPSGIGKTTQAELWNKYRDARIINGDAVFAQETQGRVLGWGTPWHGSSPYCENASAPVSALIVLRQAKKNTIRELSGFEKVTAVSRHVIYPIWLENGMELCLETLDHLLTALPVYELSCRPDEDAVRLTEDKIFGNL